VGATSEEAGFLAHTTAGGIAGLLAFVQGLFPGLAGALLEATWAGLRPASPDGLPLLGRLPSAPPVIAATGHYRNGILLAPWTGRLVARLATAPERVADEFPEAAAFAPERFASTAAASAAAPVDPGGESV
jgi:glycine oxidase